MKAAPTVVVNNRMGHGCLFTVFIIVLLLILAGNL
jgi:hypothetical protein